MQSELDITLSHDAQMSDNFDGTISQHLKFLISECLAWSHYNRISCLSQGSREWKWRAAQQQSILATQVTIFANPLLVMKLPQTFKPMDAQLMKSTDSQKPRVGEARQSYGKWDHRRRFNL